MRLQSKRYTEILINQIDDYEILERVNPSTLNHAEILSSVTKQRLCVELFQYCTRCEKEITGDTTFSREAVTYSLRKSNMG